MSEEMERILAIKGATLIDGTGTKPLENSLVLIEGSRIKAVGRAKEVEVPRDAEVIDAAGKTVMPGLIDAHIHFMGFRTHKFEETILVPEEVRLLRGVPAAEALLEAGYTTVRSTGGQTDVYLRTAIEEGTIRGPRIVAAGPVLTQTFGHADMHSFPIEWVKRPSNTICDGVPECIAAARYALRQGADFIKVCTTGGVMSERDVSTSTQFTLDEIRAIVAEAKAVGTFVASHAQGTQGVKNAIIGGVKTVEHGFYLDDDSVKLMLENDVIFVPTLSIMNQIVTRGKEAGIVEWGLRKAMEAFKAHQESIRKAYKAGVTIATGTDWLLSAPLYQPGTNAMELQLLVEKCGFTPMDVIVAATKNAAMACGLQDKIGTIEARKTADVILVDGAPLKDVRILQDRERIKMVIKEGKIEVNRLS